MPVGVHSITTTGTTSKTTTGVNTAASGSTFVILVAWNRPIALSGTPTDNKSNTYTLRGARLDNFAFDLSLAAYVCENGTGGTGHTANAQWGSDAAGSVGFFEIPGVLAASFDNIWTGNATASPFNAVTTGTFAQADTLVLGVCSSNSSTNPANASESTGFALVEESTNGASFFLLHAYEKTVAATTALTPSFTVGGGTAAGELVLAFKLGAGGGGNTLMGQVCT
jgi:hypothetical protein